MKCVLACIALVGALIAPASEIFAYTDSCAVRYIGGDTYIFAVNGSGTASGEALIGSVCTNMLLTGYAVGVSKYTRLPASYTWVCQIPGYANGDWANVWSAPDQVSDGIEVCDGAASAGAPLIWWPSP